jgi:AraC family transcriptional regulator
MNSDFNMEPRIEILNGKRFIGKRMIMSLSGNKTVELWKSFMPRRKEIKNNIGTDLYSMQVYGHSYFNNFNPNAEFEKWAAIEVTDFDTVPDEMETITLPAGLYAVFLHKGVVSTGPKTFQYIFGTWLPNSGYTLDNRPHFEILGEKYKNEDPSSEEEIWIPVKSKK